MQDNIKISVVVPVYNGEKHISKCLVHLVSQSYKNLEIIVIDDGSVDDSYNISLEFAKKDSRIKVLHQENAGPSNARNIGLNNATGKYVHFHDSDDFVELDYYEKMVHVANLTNADILCGEVYEPGFNFPRFKTTEIATGLVDKMSLVRAGNITWKYLYNRDFLNKYGIRFPKDMFFGEDKIFSYTSIYYAGTVATVPNAVYHCVDTPTALGKRREKVLSTHDNNPAARAEFIKFCIEHNLEGIRDSYRDKPDQVIKIQLLGLNIITKKIYEFKTKYYLFGMCILKKYNY